MEFLIENQLTKEKKKWDDSLLEPVALQNWFWDSALGGWVIAGSFDHPNFKSNTDYEKNRHWVVLSGIMRKRLKLKWLEKQNTIKKKSLESNSKY
jgi:hypothetical protein